MHHLPVVVVVTGANGYIGSHVVAALLREEQNNTHVVVGVVARGRTVPCGEPSERLRVVECSLDSEDDLVRVLDGIEGGNMSLVHTAAPTGGRGEGSEEEYVDGGCRVLGNVLAALERVKKTVSAVVMTSSVVAVCSGHVAERDPSYVFSEKDWADVNKTRSMHRWYDLSKTMAEMQFFKWAERHPHIRCSSVLPAWCVGPILCARHADEGSTSSNWLSCSRGEWWWVPNKGTTAVDVRDVARLHVALLSTHEPPGRYVVAPHMQDISQKQCVDALIKAGAHHLEPLPIDSRKPYRKVQTFDAGKALQALGGDLIPVEKSMADMYASFVTHKLLVI